MFTLVDTLCSIQFGSLAIQDTGKEGQFYKSNKTESVQEKLLWN